MLSPKGGTRSCSCAMAAGRASHAAVVPCIGSLRFLLLDFALRRCRRFCPCFPRLQVRPCGVCLSTSPGLHPPRSGSLALYLFVRKASALGSGRRRRAPFCASLLRTACRGICVPSWLRGDGFTVSNHKACALAPRVPLLSSPMAVRHLRLCAFLSAAVDS